MFENLYLEQCETCCIGRLGGNTDFIRESKHGTKKKINMSIIRNILRFKTNMKIYTRIYLILTKNYIKKIHTQINCFQYISIQSPIIMELNIIFGKKFR